MAFEKARGIHTKMLKPIVDRMSKSTLQLLLGLAFYLPPDVAIYWPLLQGTLRGHGNYLGGPFSPLLLRQN
ncbi:MAG: hypothetical protein Ct9H90mP16_09150 [Candidatus Poseidoniales archaeon]|nr:MAG: hypothetical protein Ct9H90mP16_09150 [Candidatus Poseidoniales archaeon]